jgi:hypothetical protein
LAAVPGEHYPNCRPPVKEKFCFSDHTAKTARKRARIALFVSIHQTMDLTGGIVAFKQAQFASRVQFAVARKILDQQEQQGAAAVQLIEAAANAGAAAGDQLVAAATGLGASLDTFG